MSAGLTWARNDFDDHVLSMKDMVDGFLKIKSQHEAQFGKPLKAVRLSRLTLLTIPMIPMLQRSSISTFFGVPVEIDNLLALWEFREVYGDGHEKTNGA